MVENRFVANVEFLRDLKMGEEFGDLSLRVYSRHFEDVMDVTCTQ